MIVTKCEPHAGGCNFCDRTLADYQLAAEFTNGGLVVRICNDCLRELITKLRNPT